MGSLELSKTSLMKALLEGPDGDVQNFWYRMRGHILYEANTKHIDRDVSIIVKIHADAAPTTKVDGMLTISWSSLHGSGTTREKKHVFTTIPK